MKRVKQIILGAATLALAGVILVGCGNNQQATAPAPADQEKPTVTATADASQAKYVGSETCKVCHTDTDKNFTMTKHAEAFKPITDFPTTAPLGEITIYDSANKEKAVSTKLDLSKAKVYGVMMSDYIVAEVPKEAGFKAQVYRVAKLEKDGDKYEVLPASQSDYNKDGQNDWGASEFTCGSCHAPGITTGTPAIATGSQDLGISCESCHGPGSLHVSAENKKGTMEVTSNACITCHKSQPTKDQNGTYLAQNHYGVRNYFASEHASNSQGCLTCHTTHEPNASGKLLKNDNPQNICASCHESENFDPAQLMWKNETDAYGHLTADHSFGAYMYKDLGDDPATKPIEIKNQKLIDLIKQKFPNL